MVSPDDDAPNLTFDVPPRFLPDVSSLRSSSNHVIRMYPFTSLSRFPHDAMNEVLEVVSNNSSGTRVFQHSDLLNEIFNYFRKDQFTPQERKSLLGFMLISKGSFHYPARILWSRIGKDFVAALRLLDIEMWDYNLDRKLSGPPLLSVLDQNKEQLTSHIMWQKFLYYTDAIEWIDATTVSVSPGTIALVASVLPGSHPVIFRSLRQLRWTEAFANSNDLLHLLNPSLVKLQLHVYDFHEGVHITFAFVEWVTRIVHASAHLCPQIRHLGVEGMGPLIVNPSILDYFATLHRLMITQSAYDYIQVIAPPTVFRALESLEMVSYHGSNSLVKSLPCILPFLANTLQVVHIQSIAGISPLESLEFVVNF